MSGYRSYVPWNKTSTSSSSTGGGATGSSSYASAKKEPSANSGATPKYESSYTKSRSDAKKSEDKSSTSSALGSKYASAYSSGYQRDTAATRSNDTSTSRSDLTTRIKSPVERKESHPPVTYRPLLRTTAGSRSRDPSPAEREKTESSNSSSSYNYNRLYPKQYSRSVSREKLDTPTSTTIPKYTGRSSLNKDDYSSKYGLGGRASRNSSREDLSLAKYKPPETRISRSSREDLSLAKYKPPETRTSRNSSREDLSLNKYKPPETKADLLSARFNKNSKEGLLSPTRYRSKEDLSSSSSLGKYKKDDLSLTKYKSEDSSSSLGKYKKEDLGARYKTGVGNSRDDLSKTPQKYITSRFLPKNSIEKSHTAYLRPSSSRSSEVSRKNRELLNVLSAQHDTSRPSSRASNIEEPVVSKSKTTVKAEPVVQELEMETLKMVTRSTSPTPPGAQTSYLRRRVDVAKLVEKQVTRPKNRGEMHDKEMQSDRLDDTTKNSRFAGASRIAAAPWSSYLDLKYSSPNNGEAKKENDSSQADDNERIEEKPAPKSSASNSASSTPRSLSRNNSSKSLSRSSSKSDVRNLKSRSNSSLSLNGDKPKVKTKSAGDGSKTKRIPTAEGSKIKKQLPPQIPKADSQSKVPTLHSLNTPNKDFRKSVLNMNPESSKLKKHTKRSTSASSAESESSNCGNSETNCDNCLKKTSKIAKSDSTSKRECRSPSTSSESSSSSTSADDEEVKVKPNKIPLSKLKKPQSAASSRTSVILSSADELSLDKSPKPPLSPRRAEKEGEAKSFLMRALAPVTNFFKHKDAWDSSENTEKNIPELPRSEEAKPLKLIRRIESGERAWWVEEGSDSSKSKGKVKLLRRVDSGERAWWLDDKAEVPQGVEVHPVTSINEDGRTEDGKLIYKIRRNDSQIREWWLDTSDSTDKNISDLPKSSSEDKSARISSEDMIKSSKISSEEKQKLSRNNSDEKQKLSWINSEDKQKPLRMICRKGSNERSWWSDEADLSKSHSKKIKIIKHVDSGERAWWLDSTVKVPPGVEVYPATSTTEDGKVEEGKLVYKIRKIESGERAWWLDPEKAGSENQEPEFLQKYKIRHIDSGERAWWISSTENLHTQDNHSDDNKPKWWLGDSQDKSDDDEAEDDEDFDDNIPLGDRASPEGLETPRDEGEECGRISPYDNVPGSQKLSRKQSLFISKHTNIDDILGGSSQLLSPLMDRIFSYQDVQDGDVEEVVPEQVRIHEPLVQKGGLQQHRKEAIGSAQKNDIRCEIVKMSLTCRVQYLNDIDPFSYTTNFPDPARPPLHTFSVTLPLINQLSAIHRLLKSPHRLDDAALQLYKDGDYGSYLDLDASISEQQEEFEGFHSNKKNSIVLRTQLSVRVHTIIEKLLTSEGRELRRALFSLKQIFQEDKDLVHEFVQNDGLACLIKVGSEADQNYQNYILRALGQVMLYVDGMNGVMEHNQTVQWLYTLISSKFRLVVKTALKLLLVFVEYTDSNCMLLIKAIHAVDSSQGLLSWHNIMKLLKDFDSADTELLIYATTLINKCLNGVPDQDTYYDQTDALEEQGIENIIQRYMSKPGTDLDLLQQFQIYEAVLQYEDGEDKGTPIRHLDESIRKTLRSRKSLVDSTERRKSRRHSTGTTPVHSGLNNNVRKNLNLQNNNDEDDESSSSQSTNGLNHQNLNGGYKDSNKTNDAGVTPALRRRRERAERQRSFMKEQQENATLLQTVKTTNDDNNENGNYTNGLQQRLSNGNNILNRNSSRKDLTERLNAANKLDSEENGLTKQPWILYNEDKGQENVEDDNTNENDRKMLLQLKKENTVKDLTQKLANQNILHSPAGDDNKINRIEGMTGLINKAKEGLAKSKSQANVVKSPTGENIAKIAEVKKSENELRWEELVSNMSRPLNLCDMDFTDLTNDDETDILAPVAVTNGIPPPPPPLEMGSAPPPPPRSCIPPVPSPPVFGVNLQKLSKPTETKIPTMKKNKKTVKLFWKEVRDDPVSSIKFKTGYIWDELNPVAVDTQKLEHLFESRAKDLINKKQQELNKNKEIIVLDPKRSNAINIGMTKLPPPRSIKTAILKMDATIMNREGIEKLLTMLPTEEERSKIQEAQAANPDLPLGSAEQFLLTLASISELPARLRLWAFKLDFENTEREIAEPLMDLKQGLEVLRVNKTFRGILSTLLSIGNFLNGNEVKGFQIEYLSKVPEVKDTVHKHSLLHHLCHIVMEKFPDASDLYSEIGAITRASKVDFDELALNIQRLEADCKASWDHLKLIAKHDGSTMKSKMSDFLADCAERIILLGIIHRRVMNRFYKFLLWLGIPLHQIADTKPNEFCRIVSEFALEYRTTRERVLQQLEKKANHRERNKTRGKMITETAKFRTKEDRADAELRQLLGSDISDVESLQGTLPFRRTRKDANRALMNTLNGNLTDGDDEILESLVKTATKAPSSRTAPRERKRTRHADRKSLKRSRTRENPFGHRDSP